MYRKSKHKFLSSVLSRKSCHLRNNPEKYSTAGQGTDDNIIERVCFAYCTIIIIIIIITIIFINCNWVVTRW